MPTIAQPTVCFFPAGQLNWSLRKVCYANGAAHGAIALVQPPSIYLHEATLFQRHERTVRERCSLQHIHHWKRTVTAINERKISCSKVEKAK